jgi:leukotriene-A4 hydrolase
MTIIILLFSKKHYWLNEGWTVFIERKILGRLSGEATRQFAALSGKYEKLQVFNRLITPLIGLKSLQEDVDLFGKDSPKTIMNPDLSGGADPDDYFSEIPYGSYFFSFCIITHSHVISNRKGIQLFVSH